MSPVIPSPTVAKNSPSSAGLTRHRLIVVSLALLSLILAWSYMAVISRTDPWYRNTDMNIHNMVDALAINADISPYGIDQPAVPLKYLLALDYRVRHYLGYLPVWNMKKFGASADPLQAIPPLIRIGRVHSRSLTLLLILAAATLTYAVTRKIETAGVTVILLCGAAGVLFHGLLTRPELLCVGLGNVLALGCAWRATSVRRWYQRHAWLFLAGLFGGLAALAKLPGVGYLALAYGWVWLAAMIPPETPEAAPRASPPESARFWAGLVSAIGGLSILWLLARLADRHEALGPVVILRLRIAAVSIGVLYPLLAFWEGRHRVGLFLVARGRDLALIGGGALAALSLSYFLLRGVLTEPRAAEYITGTLRVLVDPGPYMKSFVAADPRVGREFVTFVKETPFLFLGVTTLLLVVFCVRAVPLRLKAFCALLWIGAIGLTLLMSRRHFLAQYSIFPQVPLLIACALCFSALETIWQARRPAAGLHWASPLAIAAAFVVMLTVYFRLQPKYDEYQDDAALPVRDLTLTFLFDHDAHPAAYREVMKSHYGDRQQFSETLQRRLANPANRH